MIGQIAAGEVRILPMQGDWCGAPLALEVVRAFVGRRSAEVQAVAREYFVDTTLTRAVLDPLPLADQPPRSAKPGMRH